MKKTKIEWWLETPTFTEKGEVEVEDGASEAEIEEIVKEEVFNLISWGWDGAK